MGNIAEMILDGVLCEQCGTFIGEPVGHPRLCTMCDFDNCIEELIEELDN